MLAHASFFCFRHQLVLMNVVVVIVVVVVLVISIFLSVDVAFV